ncbi:MAG TPA: metal-dependent hydrolase [Nevskiaceae bacterium]|nr:metal-dependent hydrolase [Nevskiaceae bacterium]
MADGSYQPHSPVIQPLRRDLRFGLDGARIHDWHGEGPAITQFMNTLSLFFPEGERFFIGAVRHYRDRITDPALQKAITGFIGQEAMHGREHSDFNQLMEDAGLPAARLEKIVTVLLKRLQKNLPAATQLSATIALEHMTAVLGDYLLKNEDFIRSAEPAYGRLWRWHALEETEHKAVAFDVWKAVMPRTLGSYLHRTGGLIVATGLFMVLVAAFQVQMVAAAPRQQSRMQALGSMLRFLFVKPGLLPNVTRPMLDYFRPGFHPWDHDNRHFLAQMGALEAELAAA